ncbi:Hypothetical_protein [Hexamita inflata]|uniref:Hypothetical_protein n=1 Tax=Hexamita inflata TaxID=28002 RepID=A0AA86N4V6_9EUKA|nr:Hypothetical protein HINF_LOCUS426 [Hexamita inflata]
MSVSFGVLRCLRYDKQCHIPTFDADIYLFQSIHIFKALFLIQQSKQRQSLLLKNIFRFSAIVDRFPQFFEKQILNTQQQITIPIIQVLNVYTGYSTIKIILVQQITISVVIHKHVNIHKYINVLTKQRVLIIPRC